MLICFSLNPHDLWCCVQDKVQDVLGQQLDDTDTEAVMNEFAAMEAAALDEELDKMPKVPTAAAEAAAAATAAEAGTEAQPAAAAEAVAVEEKAVEEELPSVPKSKVRREFEGRRIGCRVLWGMC